MIDRLSPEDRYILIQAAPYIVIIVASVVTGILGIIGWSIGLSAVGWLGLASIYYLTYRDFDINTLQENND